MCTTKLCTYCRIDDELCCINGDGSCVEADFVEPAILTSHHDETLAGVTRKIKELFSTIPADADRKLSILRTSKGLILAWVRHRDLERNEGAPATVTGPEVDEWLGLGTNLANPVLNSDIVTGTSTAAP
jgi:hypothetical protein